MRNFLNHIKTMKNNEKLLNLAVALNFSFGIRDALSIFKENKRKSELVVRKSSVYFFRIFKMKTFKIKSKEKKSNYLKKLNESTLNFERNWSKYLKQILIKNLKKRYYDSKKMNELIKINSSLIKVFQI